MITRRNFFLQSALAVTTTLSRGGYTNEESGQNAEIPHLRLADDPHRPQYHFLPKANWINDPNGPIFWKGYYHLFYQYSSQIFPQGRKDWGHARSMDMVHWEHLPMALIPTPGGPDKDGVWSGSAFVNEGVPTLVYTGVSPQVQCLATSDDDLMTWKKFRGNPVIGSPPAGLAVTGFRDPAIWREGNAWLMTVGAGFRDQGGAVLLFASKDLAQWDYVHPVFTAPPLERVDPAHSNPYDSIRAGDMWECPDFFPLGRKHVLLVSTQGRVHYFVGTYADRKFTAEAQGLIDGSALHYASKTFEDDHGRRILVGWVREARSKAAQNSAGWSGAISLPRVLSIDSDGALHMEPLPEVARLRGRHHQIVDADVADFTSIRSVRGSSLEISLILDVDQATECGLSIRRSPDAEEETTISYDASTRNVVLATDRSSLNPDAVGGTYRSALNLSHGEPLALTVFLDGSVVEVFANGRACLTGRIYPTRSDSIGIGLLARNGRARVKLLDVYEMKAISHDRLTT